jgi:hypothetical protein
VNPEIRSVYHPDFFCKRHLPQQALQNSAKQPDAENRIRLFF